MDPCIQGRYPAEGLKAYQDELPPIRSGDMQTIRQPMDFLGFNHYNGPTVRCGADGKPEVVPQGQNDPITAFKWRVTPASLYWGPKFFWERYRLPVYITENGLSNADWVSLDGRVHDPQRIDFLNRYLLSLRRAAGEGVPVKGYFTWSILDNFEWAEGYKERFGLIYVDYQTQKRILKDSAHWYRQVIATHGGNL
jgi:beta-glucosidase